MFTQHGKNGGVSRDAISIPRSRGIASVQVDSYSIHVRMMCVCVCVCLSVYVCVCLRECIVGVDEPPVSNL